MRDKEVEEVGTVFGPAVMAEDGEYGGHDDDDDDDLLTWCIWASCRPPR